VRGNEATYEFITLSPKDTFKLIYPLEYLYFDKIVKEFDLKDLKTGYTPNIFEYPNKIKYCKSKGLKKYPLIFEFALYERNDILNIKKSSNLYLQTNMFKQSILNFEVLKVFLE
jgi:hypothetical protein